MVFSSTEFLFLFLPLSLIGYFIINRKFQNLFLLFISIIFYALGEPKFVFVMMISIVINYLLALLIEQYGMKYKLIKKLFLILALVLNIGLLFYYKYYNFTIENINLIFKTSIPVMEIVLPIGISFFTFQGLSYVLDVYMKKVMAQKKLVNVAMYIALFPQLVAGPIVRYSDINNEIEGRNTKLNDFSSGICRFAVGLAKKSIIANNIALLANQAFDRTLDTLTTGIAWLGIIAYTLQIYFDFSGYSDMAIGLGRMFGFHFNENFKYPYISTNVSQFWRRWHISLSQWFRDYVYIPLGGNRKGNVYFNLIVVFLLTGIWHGASWNFVMWGLWHGIFLIIERVMKNKNITINVPVFIKWIYTIIVVMIGWIMFRSTNLEDAVYYIKCLIGINGTDYYEFIYTLQDYLALIVIALVASLPILPNLKKYCTKHEEIGKYIDWLEPVFLAVVLCAGVSYTVASTYNPFIYFNF